MIKYISLSLIVILFIFSFDSCSKNKNDVQYWTCPMEEHSHIKLDRPGSCPECGMKLVPVKKKQEIKGHKHNKKAYEIKEKSEVFYWTCGMHPSVRSDTPGKCPICQMGLTPIYKKDHKEAEEKINEPFINITPREKALIGIKTQKAAYRKLTKEIVTVGRIAYDPELTVAEEEYLTALNTYEKIQESRVEESKKRAKKLVEQAEYRLRLLGLGKEIIGELKQTKRIHTNVILPEDTVWVYADIYESDIGIVKTGQKVNVEVTAYPGEFFTGKIRAIDPVVNPRTRSIRIRAEIKNPELKLKPDMYANVRIEISLGKLLSVPADAVLDTGLRKVVWIDLGEGKYMSKDVQTGFTGWYKHNSGKKEKFIVIKEELKHGDTVVTRANFLIDSQSQLTGPAESVYGGAIKGEKTSTPHTVHGH